MSLIASSAGCFSDEGDNRLHSFRADNGEPLATPPETMRGLHHFWTLIAAKDRRRRIVWKNSA
jgi:hypothetical protein